MGRFRSDHLFAGCCAVLTWIASPPLAAQSLPGQAVPPAVAFPEPPRARLVIQTGLEEAPELAWSPDRALLVARAGKHVAVLEASTGRELRRWEVPSRHELRSRELISFVGGGARFAGPGATKSTLALWNALTGQAIAEHKLRSDPRVIAASPAGDLIAVAELFLDEVLLLDGALRPVARISAELPRSRSEDPRILRGFAWSPDGRRIALYHSSGWVAVWDVPGARQLAATRVHNDLESVQWDDDGSLLVLQADGAVARWDGLVARRIARSADSWRGAYRLLRLPGRSWALAAPDGVTILDRDLRPRGRVPGARNVAAGSEGTGLALGYPDGEIARWSYPGLQREWFVPGQDYSWGSLVVSAQGRHAVQSLVGGSHGRTAPARFEVWDLEDGKPVASVAMPRAPRAFHVKPALSADAQWLAGGSDRGDLLLWSAQDGQQRRTERLAGRSVTALAFDAAGARLLVATADPRVHEGVEAAIAEMEDSFDTDKYRAHVGKAYRALVKRHPPDLRVWDLAASRWTATLRLSESLDSLVVDPATGQWAGAGMIGGVVLGDLRSARYLGEVSHAAALRFAPGGGRLLAAGLDDAVVWDLAAPAGTPGTRIATLDRGTGADWLPDGSAVLVSDRAGLRRVAWPPAGAPVARPVGGTGSASGPASASHLHVLPHGLLMALDERGAAGVWRLADGTRAVHWAALADGSWVVADPEGRFDAARPDHIPQAHWVLDHEPGQALPIELLLRDFYEPQLLARILTRERLAPIPRLGELDRLRASLRIEQVRPAAEGQGVDVTVSAVPAGAPAVLRDLKLFLDGQLVGVAFDEQPLAVGARVTHVFRQVQLPPGPAGAQHVFTAYGFNRAGIKTVTAAMPYRTERAITGAAPRAHLIAVGIDHYAAAQWTLGFAGSDARAVHQALQRHLVEAGAFGEVRAQVLASDAAAPAKTGKAALLQAIASLAQGPGRARPQDTIYLTWAGHGMRDEAGQFHLLTSDFAGTEGGEARWKAAAISMEEIAAALRPVQAAQWVLVIDACHSAATVTGGGFKAGPMASRGLGQLAYDKRMRVLAASQESGVAFESGTLKGGLLTHALVHEGLREGRADFLPVDDVVSVNEWLRYGRQRVPSLLDGGAGRGAKLVGASTDRGAAQKPALFDFAGIRSMSRQQVVRSLSRAPAPR